MPTTLDCHAAINDDDLAALRAGDEVEITGEMITVRDGTASRLEMMLKRGEALPVDLRGRLLYAVGPSPTQPGQVVGSAGPPGASSGKGLHGDIVKSFPELGPEAIHRFQVARFPAVVSIDSIGGNLHEPARAAWRR